MQSLAIADFKVVPRSHFQYSVAFVHLALCGKAFFQVDLRRGQLRGAQIFCSCNEFCFSILIVAPAVFYIVYRLPCQGRGSMASPSAEASAAAQAGQSPLFGQGCLLIYPA